MATMITSECINCGACEPECPNTAIYQGGVEWELNGVKHPALASDIFYIVPEKCTECVGFFDHEACAAVCPVDCCIPNPDIPETEEVLIARAKQLHPGEEFPGDFPSRFRKAEAAAPTAPAPAAPSAEAAAAPAPAAAPALAQAPAAAPAAPAAGPARIERPLVAPKARVAYAARPAKTFREELSISFEDAIALLRKGAGRRGGRAKLLVALAQPLLGALPYRHKLAIERAVGDRRYFTAAGATGLNVLHNMILYPLLLAAAGALLLDRAVFSDQLNNLIFFGVVIAALETWLRMREGFRVRAPQPVAYRAALYGPALLPLAAPLVYLLKPADVTGTVGQDGFHRGGFDDKIERERRYGEVYRLNEENNGYLLEFEFPRRVPPSAIKEELGVPDDMPDYDYELSLQNGFFVVKGKVVEPEVRKVASVSPAFPPDFATQIKLPSPVAGFRHRLRKKTLEVALLKTV
jgi:ferredoxin